MLPLKTKVQYILQKLLGFERYLRLFANFKIRTIKWDKKENDFFTFLELLPSKGLVLDIGANLGVMTHFINQHGNHVWAIEPLKQNLQALYYAQRTFGWANVIVWECAVGNESGEVEMVIPEVDDVKKQGLSHVVHDSITEFNQGTRYKVPIHRVDEMVLKQAEPVVGIKLDVENFEYFALVGAEETLKKFKPIIYTELWENENRDKCFEFLKSLGYSCQVAENGVPVNYNPEIHHTQNFIFIPQ